MNNALIKDILEEDINKFIDYVSYLEIELEAYENMRKEIIEFINLYAGESNNFCLDYHDLIKLRNILNKVGEDNE